MRKPKRIWWCPTLSDEKDEWFDTKKECSYYNYGLCEYNSIDKCTAIAYVPEAKGKVRG